MERLPKLKVTPMEMKQQGVRLPHGVSNTQMSYQNAQPLSWETDYDPEPLPEPRVERESTQPARFTSRVSARARGYVQAGRARFGRQGRQQRPKREGEKKPIAFFSTLGGQAAVCTAIILCALVLRTIDTPATQAVTAGVKDAVTTEVDLDQSIGKLKFVQNLFPDTVAVLSQEKAPEALQPPFNGKVTGMYSMAAPGIEITGDKEAVYACYEGKVTQVAQQDDGSWSITVEHTGGLQTVYAQLSAAIVTNGDRLTKGQQVGLAQEGEDETSYKMFLQVKLDDVVLDPLPYFK